VLAVADSKALGYANNPKFFVDKDGTAYLALRSKAARGAYNICLVRAKAPWAPEHIEQTWLEDRDGVEVSGAPQRVASIAAGPDGSVHMVWYGGSATKPDHQVRYARFATGKATRIAEERAPFVMPGFDPKWGELWQEHACIAVGADGTAHVAWEARDPYRRAKDGTPKPGIAYATRSPAGVWSVSGELGRPPYLQTNDRYPSQSRPTVLVDRAGTVHLLCYGAVESVQQVLYGRYDAHGFSGWKPVAPSSGDQRHIGAALDRAGRLHVAWREGQASKGAGGAIAVFYSVMDADGRWQKAQRLSGPDEDASTPAVGVSDSSVSVAWIAWSPGAKNAEGQRDNGYPADNNTVDGRLEVASRRFDSARFDAPSVVDAGPASYPCWAAVAEAGDVRPPLAWIGGDLELHLGWCERPKPAQ